MFRASPGENGAAAERYRLYVFVASIPYLFHRLVLVLLMQIFVNDLMSRFGPVRLAEQRAGRTGELGTYVDTKIYAFMRQRLWTRISTINGKFFIF